MMSKPSNKYACDYTLVAINLVGDAMNASIAANAGNHHISNNNQELTLIATYNRDKDKDSNNNNNNNSGGGDNNNNQNEVHHEIHQHSQSSGDILGFVTMASLSISLNEFREKMREQLPSLPSHFGFLSKEGWPVSEIQELHLSLYYVINESLMVMIRRLFDKQRFGIQAMSGVSLGFIFADLEDTAHDIRVIINHEFNDTIREGNGYLLVDRNDWPIAVRQESMIKVWDLMKNGVIRIIPSKRCHNHDTTDYAMEVVEENLDAVTPQKKKKRPSEASTLDIRNVSSEEVLPPIISMSHTEHSNSAALVSSETQYRPHLYENKPILISYVRAEAEQHARQLKSELTELGCPVFLDVDEIEGGHDWQDALNNAVLNCDLFVPLITPQYGYTQWTNREVKLADIKHKSILPISFLNNWPPECLAIQFASTQFIPWKSERDIEKAISKGEGDRAQDIRFWDQPYVKSTAIKINDHYHNAMSIASVSATTSLITPEFQATATIQALNQSSIAPLRPQSLNHPFILQSPAALYVQQQQLPSISNETPKKRINIVISAHPKQHEFVALIREELTKFNFDVWSSTDMALGNCADIGSDLLTPVTPTATVPSSQFDSGSVSDHSSDQTLYIGGNTRRNSDSSQDSQIPTSHEMIDRMRKRLTFTLTSDSTPINYAHSSQNFGSQYEFFSQQSNFSPEDLDKAKNFRQRADASCIVIMVLSKAYCSSRTCKQQAFYCNFRKILIPIKYDEFQMPHWLSKLFDDEDLIVRTNDSDNDQSLISALKIKAKSLALSKDILTFKCAMSEAKIHSLASFISKKLPFHEKKKIFVYISGSTKFFSPSSEPICRAIGQALAGIPYLTLVTGGSYGCGDTVGRSFCEERELVLKEKPANLFHILPRHVTKDATLKARQNPDGTFQTVPFGQTLFIGQSFSERDSVVARLFNYCILIEGGPRSARIAEEFVWHDNIVIPIICTGGAAAGHFDLPPKIHDVPIGVHTDDWSTLGRRDVTAESIAEAVKNIIYCMAKCRLRKKIKESKHQTSINKLTNKTRVTKVRTKN